MSSFQEKVEEEEEEIKECVCGQRHHPDNICGHGYAAGICCVCEECLADVEKE